MDPRVSYSRQTWREYGPTGKLLPSDKGREYRPTDKKPSKSVQCIPVLLTHIVTFKKDVAARIVR